MNIMRVGITVLFFVFLLAGCYYDSKEYLFPEINSTCDTSSITYSGSVRPILGDHCYTCHSNTSAGNFGGNIKLENYADVVIQADNGKLLGTISHQSGYFPMPQGAAKLDDCSISIIRIWIQSGTPDN
jgi:hypothetical protein